MNDNAHPKAGSEYSEFVLHLSFLPCTVSLFSRGTVHVQDAAFMPRTRKTVLSGPHRSCAAEDLDLKVLVTPVRFDGNSSILCWIFSIWQYCPAHCDGHLSLGSWGFIVDCSYLMCESGTILVGSLVGEHQSRASSVNLQIWN